MEEYLLNVSCNVLLVFFHKVQTNSLYFFPYIHVQFGMTFEALQRTLSGFLLVWNVSAVFLSLFSDLSKWERVSKMRFKHENVHLVPYPYICTMYLELNSFQQTVSCGKSVWLCLENFWKHLWSVSSFLFIYHVFELEVAKLCAVWPYDGFEIEQNSVFPFVLCCFSKISWISLCLFNHFWLFS